MNNKDSYSDKKHIKEYSDLDYFLQPEQTILNELKKAKIEGRMLDIGVGGGRTTKYFSPVFNNYVGLDYSAGMVEVCKNKYTDNNLSFVEGDARDLKDFEDNTFDFIMFSFNGIDCVNFEDRSKVLNEILRVGKPGSLFAFSVHNSYNIPRLFSYQMPKNPFKYIGEYKRMSGVKKRNKDIDTLLATDYAGVIDGDLDFTAEYIYIKPEAQIEHLKQHGFSDIKAYSLKDGKEITLSADWAKINDAWIHFLCINKTV